MIVNHTEKLKYNKINRQQSGIQGDQMTAGEKSGQLKLII